MEKKIRWPECRCKRGGCTGHKTPKGVLSIHKGNPIISVYRAGLFWCGTSLDGRDWTLAPVETGALI